MVKRRLIGSGKFVSVAAPASYWYLKAYPVDKVSEVVDYIIYLMYDLHGQWDHANKWFTPGCEEGNCSRSSRQNDRNHHGSRDDYKGWCSVQQGFCGIASYGRSFKMAEEGRIGPNCHFTGTKNVSEAIKGHA